MSKMSKTRRFPTKIKKNELILEENISNMLIFDNVMMYNVCEIYECCLKIMSSIYNISIKYEYQHKILNDDIMSIIYEYCETVSYDERYIFKKSLGVKYGPYIEYQILSDTPQIYELTGNVIFNNETYNLRIEHIHGNVNVTHNNIKQYVSHCNICYDYAKKINKINICDGCKQTEYRIKCFQICHIDDDVPFGYDHIYYEIPKEIVGNNFVCQLCKTSFILEIKSKIYGCCMCDNCSDELVVL